MKDLLGRSAAQAIDHIYRLGWRIGRAAAIRRGPVGRRHVRACGIVVDGQSVIRAFAEHRAHRRRTRHQPHRRRGQTCHDKRPNRGPARNGGLLIGLHSENKRGRPSAANTFDRFYGLIVISPVASTIRAGTVGRRHIRARGIVVDGQSVIRAFAEHRPHGRRTRHQPHRRRGQTCHDKRPNRRPARNRRLGIRSHQVKWNGV